MSPLELLLFGARCYLFGLVAGALVIPWLVGDLFPPRSPQPALAAASVSGVARRH